MTIKQNLIEDYLDFKEHFKFVSNIWYSKDNELKIDIFFKAVFGEKRLLLKKIHKSLLDKTYVPEIEDIDINIFEDKKIDGYVLQFCSNKHLTKNMKEVRIAFALYLSIKGRKELAKVFRNRNTTTSLFDFVNNAEESLKAIRRFEEEYPND